jgi:hypothetical protein
MNLLERLYKLVEEDPHHKGSYYASKLDMIAPLRKSLPLLNACFFNLSETDRPAWKVVGPSNPARSDVGTTTAACFSACNSTVEPPPTVSIPQKIYADAAHDLFGWQKLAYKNWVDRGRRGIIEAVTGAGKTRWVSQRLKR